MVLLWARPIDDPLMRKCYKGLRGFDTSRLFLIAEAGAAASDNFCNFFYNRESDKRAHVMQRLAECVEVGKQDLNFKTKIFGHSEHFCL